MARSVVLLVNRIKEGADAAAEEVASLVRAHGELLGVLDDFDRVPDGRASEADLVVVLGGDGTILTTARVWRDLRAPILGVNLGKVGFMAAYDVEDVRRHAPSLFGDGGLVTHRISMIRATVEGGPAGGEELEAVNEFAITAGPPFRMIRLGLTLDGQPGPEVRGDGLIVSTPMGSTAYNVSAGGPIVAPGTAAMVITPIAAQSLAFRPIVLDDDREIEVTVLEANEENGEGTTLLVDGQERRRVREGQRVRFRGGGRRIELVTNPDVGYWKTLMTKMGWAARPRRS